MSSTQPDPIEKRTDEDMEAISQMLIAAEHQGLLTEVVWSFAREVRTSDIPTAAAAALYDWDI